MKSNLKFLDRFTKIMLVIAFTILLCIFISSKYMYNHKMDAGGTDDVVNTMASKKIKAESHPFIELPGDSQVGAFTIAGFFSGIIIGHHWEKLFAKPQSSKNLYKEE